MSLKVALFIPCYIDQIFPEVGMATAEVLEKLGCELEYPEKQTCCGQPMGNMGAEKEVKAMADHFVKTFSGYDYIVCPSGSCTHMVKHEYKKYLVEQAEYEKIQANTYEFCQFLVEVIGLENLHGNYSKTVGLHKSCHGLRGLRLGSCSEQMVMRLDYQSELLKRLTGLQIVSLEREDECCGFGGTFSVTEKDVSVQMGLDRIKDHQRAGVNILVGGDCSCLMHMRGIARKKGIPFEFLHIAEVLAEGLA
jgi:L-lactate dehydrogenase complex protein LldE